MWNYAGYEQLSSITGEMKNPQKTFVRILAWNTPMNILTYILPTTLALAVLGNWQEWKTDYIVTASRLIGGPALGAAMLIAAMIGTLSLSNSTILYTTRVPATMAQTATCPRGSAKFTRVTARPTRAIAVSTIGLLHSGEVRRRGHGQHLHLDAHRHHAAHAPRRVANAPENCPMRRAASAFPAARWASRNFDFSAGFVRAENRAK